LEYRAKLIIPEGVRDLLPEEARAFRKIERRIMDFFVKWGYEEVITPTFEFLETFQQGALRDQESLYKFIDRRGKILALRPEMTTPIARLVATSLRNRPLPLRLCYSARVFRYELPQKGRWQEFQQLGVELLGDGGKAADVEVLALAIEVLLLAGVRDFRLGLGQVAVTKGVLAALELPEEGVEEIKGALLTKNLVKLNSLIEHYGLKGQKRKQLEALATLRGKKEVLAWAREGGLPEGAASALARLEEVWRELVACGLGNWVFFDLGILRDFDYYTGIVFEGYAEGLGAPLCGGGRYDGLLERFGYPLPAVGFALGLERLLMVLGERGEERKGFLVAGPSFPEISARAREVRASGVPAVLFLGEDRALAEEQARKRGLSLLWVE